MTAAGESCPVVGTSVPTVPALLPRAHAESVVPLEFSPPAAGRRAGAAAPVGRKPALTSRRRRSSAAGRSPAPVAGPAQVRSGHAREQVVFDLVVQATQDEVDDSAAADVAGGQHLPAQVVPLFSRLEDRHALVVRGERAAHAEAEDACLGLSAHRGSDARSWLQPSRPTPRSSPGGQLTGHAQAAPPRPCAPCRWSRPLSAGHVLDSLIQCRAARVARSRRPARSLGASRLAAHGGPTRTPQAMVIPVPRHSRRRPTNHRRPSPAAHHPTPMSP